MWHPRTHTGDDKYSLHDRENLQQQIQIQLSSKKQKLLSEFFDVFLKYTSSFKHLNFIYQYNPHSSFTCEITDYERCG